MTSNLAAQYAKSMRLHPYGHGFFDPQPSDVVRPGVCGYIDELGQWQPITDLANESTLHAARFSIAKTVVKFKTRKHEWGPKVSEAVRFTKVELDMGASGVPAGIPLEASMLVDYQTTTDFGAILVCPSTVVQEGYYHRNPFSQWAQENASAILKAQPDVKTDGFWIVTSTYAAADIWINAWRSKDHHVTIGFKAGAAAVGEIAPSGEFYRADSASGWIHPLVEADETRVVFLSGLHFKYRRLPLGRDSLEEVRGTKSVVITDPANEEVLYTLSCETVGYDEDD